MSENNRSNRILCLRPSILIPLLLAIAMSLNTGLSAQQATPGSENVRIEEEVEVITKDFSKSDLSNLKSNLLKQGIEMKHKKLKYNDASEIVGIELSVSNKFGNSAKMSQKGDQPIAPISIRFDKINGTLALGNTSALHESHADIHSVIVKDLHKKIHKEIVIDENGKKEVIVIQGDGADNFSTEDIDVKVMKDGNVWVSESGDSTVVKHIKVSELDEDSDGTTKVIIKKSGIEHEDIDVKIKTPSGAPGENEFLFMDNAEEQPLIIIDGKEMRTMQMKDIDHKNIETIEVIKGNKAIEKYGEKARNGIVIIKTRK